MTENLVGAAAIGLPLLFLVALTLRRQPSAIRAFAVALVLVGTGYLMATGAAAGIGRTIVLLAQGGPPTVRERAAPAGTPAPNN